MYGFQCKSTRQWRFEGENNVKRDLKYKQKTKLLNVAPVYFCFLGSTIIIVQSIFLMETIKLRMNIFFLPLRPYNVAPPLRPSVNRIKNNTNIRFFIINYERRVLNCSVFVFRKIFFKTFLNNWLFTKKKHRRTD